VLEESVKLFIARPICARIYKLSELLGSDCRQLLDKIISPCNTGCW